MKKIILKKKYLTLLLPTGILLSYLAQFFPHVIEHYYSQGINAAINQLLSSLTGLLPFSLAEILAVLLIFVSFISVCRLAVRLFKKRRQRKKIVMDFLLNTFILISTVYFSFILLWGLNYYRQPFAAIADLEIKQATVVELEDLCRFLIAQANSLRKLSAEDENGVMRLQRGRTNVFQSASEGFARASIRFPQLGREYGRPKGVLLSELMSYTGITGIYFPFTGEANVNISIPECMLPSTTCHEMAHQRGFAREDDYASVLCMQHPDADFQYSGTLLALINSINALYKHAPEQALQLQEEYSEGLQRDLRQRKLFWQQYEGPLEEISREINDSYLKANRQTDGVHSYGRMVDLLLAEYRQQQNANP